MKGFPNQVADLQKLTSALKVFSDLLESNVNPRDDGVYGEALVRAGVAGTGHRPRPVEEYLKIMRTKTPSNQSHRTRARGLRELFRVMDLIQDDGDLQITKKGRKILELHNKPLDEEAKDVWRDVILKMQHYGGEGTASHPYQVLLRLVASSPGITRAKCALALEALDDSTAELNRILTLAGKSEQEIIQSIRVTKANWDNAKKILPHFAEQLGDVIKKGQQFYIANFPGSGKEKKQAATKETPKEKQKGITSRKPKSSSKVTAETIAKAGSIDNFDEDDDGNEPQVDPEAIKNQIAKTKNRLKRHNEIVRFIAKVLEQEGANLYENPFDCLACYDKKCLLIEVKSLDGTSRDEVVRVRDALSQLLYYESFVVDPNFSEEQIIKIACFESKIDDKHIKWLDKSGIATIWLENGMFATDQDSVALLVGHFGLKF
jgi:hypothetical protein